MAAFVVLDSEALSALAWPRERAVSARRAQAVLAEADRRNAQVRIPSSVLVEAYTGTARDAGIDRVVGRANRIVPLDHGIARLAGQLISRDGLDSCHAGDATVVATAVRLGGALVLTSDPDDLRALARDFANVAVQPLDQPGQ